MSLALMDLADGAELQGKGDAPSTEVLYFVSGGGSVRVGGETSTLAPEAMLYLPRGTAYTIKAALGEKGDKILVAQFKVPTGARPRAPTPAPTPSKK